MCVGIVLEVFEIRFVLRYQSAKKAKHIAFDVRVSILINGQSTGSMLREKHENAFALSALSNGPLGLSGDIDHFFAFMGSYTYRPHSIILTQKVQTADVVDILRRVID